MSYSSSANGPSTLERVMQGIVNTTLPDEDKERLLKRIQKEGGIYSAALRKELVDLFRQQQAEQEEIARDAAEQLQVMDTERAKLSAEDSAETRLIVDELIGQQRSEFKTFDNGIQAMKADILRMERNEMEAEKKTQADIDAAEAEQLRKNLQGGL